MKTLSLVFLLALTAAAVPARAAVTVEAYIAERDKAIAALHLPEGQEPTAADDARDTAALSRLQTMIRALIGPVRLPGFAAPGTISLVTLQEGMVGLGRLDGLSIKSLDGTTTGIVTTDALLRDWLRNAAGWQGLARNSPVEPDAAFADARFFTAALSIDSSAELYAELPVERPPGQGAVRVLLVRFGQDYTAPNPPDTLLAAADNGLVLVLRAHVSSRIGQIPACKSAFDRETAAAEAVYSQYQASGTTNAALFDRYEAMGEAANTHFLHCFGNGISKRPEYPALLEQAAKLADRAAAR